MRYFALACDYDGTLAADGRVSERTVAALERLRASGRRLLLVSGRELEDLQRTFSRLDLFDLAVLENGALLYDPATRAEKVLGERPPADFVRELRARGVGPVSAGRVIVATWTPHETAVLEVIRDLGLELQVIFNKGAVMVLPSGVNKATGLAAALDELGLSAHNAVGVGDAENDHAFLNLCECGVAVANALPTLQERADYVTAGDHGAGVEEIITMLLSDDLRELGPRLHRSDIALGQDEADKPVRLRPYGENLLVAGSSQGGKTTFTTGVIERLIERGYQVCVVDPEGDYTALAGVVTVGGEGQTPPAEEALELLAKPGQSVAVNLLSVPLADRPAFLAGLLPRLQSLRARTGRPHWVVLDEAHHMLPADWEPAVLTLPQDTFGLLMITLDPGLLAAAALAAVDTVVAIGESPTDIIRSFAATAKLPLPALPQVKLEKGEGVHWAVRAGRSPVRFRSQPPSGVRLRHHRKYAEGELAPEWSFYFRGPEGKLNLRAQNLILFLQLADGVDDETWLYHLRRREYSRWFREHIKDEELAEEANRVESDPRLSARESRAQIREAVEQRYTAP